MTDTEIDVIFDLIDTYHTFNVYDGIINLIQKLIDNPSKDVDEYLTYLTATRALCDKSKITNRPQLYQIALDKFGFNVIQGLE